jgi:outer membrane protein OmpA-like peptidoglycan-associated protein
MPLLKGPDGRITLQVPVKGNVKDPQFDVAEAVTSALTGTIENAEKAPFATVAEIDGFTGEELQRVEFDFGFSDLKDREVQKLKALAKFLAARDVLTLGIQATADKQMDWAAISGTLAGRDTSGGDPASEKKMPAAPAGELDADLERLQELAQGRAEVVSAFLTEQAGIGAERIRIEPVKINPAPAGDSGRVEFSLSAQ